MKNRTIGTIVISVSLCILIILIYYNLQISSLLNELMNLSGGRCLVDGECMHEKSFLPLYLGYSFIVLLIGFGLCLVFFDIKEKNKILVPRNLDEDEKKILEILNAKEGSAYQSDLVKETGFSKVRITRILDRLENKKLIDRKRRGMTNIVFLK